MEAIEMTGIVDEDGQLRLDTPIAPSHKGPVRVILLFAEEDISEQQWLQAAARNPAFAFLEDAEEDIYTVEDGKPFSS
ncbi:MAG TPA: hypothetical protein VKP65_19485 [Rhodothermales bacterium]|nr:hypothetical protein [Rhodothermales bacterium]